MKSFKYEATYINNLTKKKWEVSSIVVCEKTKDVKNTFAEYYDIRDMKITNSYIRELSLPYVALTKGTL